MVEVVPGVPLAHRNKGSWSSYQGPEPRCVSETGPRKPRGIQNIVHRKVRNNTVLIVSFANAERAADHRLTVVLPNRFEGSQLLKTSENISFDEGRVRGSQKCVTAPKAHRSLIHR
jgi:hypothetical protein